MAKATASIQVLVKLRPIEKEILKTYCEQTQQTQTEVVRQLIRQLPKQS